MTNNANESTVQRLVEDVLRSPALRSCIETCLNTQTSVGQSNVRGNSTNNNVRNVAGSSSSAIDEIRRLFPSIRPPSSSIHPTTPTFAASLGTKRRRVVGVKNRPYLKEVILLRTSTECRTLIGKEKAKAYDDGFALSAVKFERFWNNSELMIKIQEIFVDKIQGEFELLVPMSGYLVRPKLNDSDQINGENLAKIFYNKTIYVRPELHNRNDSMVNDEVHQDLNNSDIPAEVNEIAESDIIAQSEPSSLAEILHNLRNIVSDEKNTFFNIYREDIFNCCIRAIRRKSFAPNHKISVLFTDCDNTSEGAVDAGGPKREMFRLLFHYLSSSCLFNGSEDKKFITLNKEAIENKLYYEAGRLTALAIVHCGMGPRFFSEMFFTLLTQGPDEIEPTLEDLTNPDIRHEVEMALNATDLTAVRHVILEGSYIALAGWEIFNNIDKKDIMIKDVLKFYVIDRCLPSFNQYKEGLETLGVYGSIKTYPEYFVELMCRTAEGVLTQTKFNETFSIQYSEPGSTKRQVESRIIAFWHDLLIECDENDSENECSLEDILVFATAVNVIPPNGFVIQPTIKFSHDDPSPFPRGNTCGLELYLPTTHEDYEKFKYFFTFGVKNGMVFGYA